MSAKRPAKNGKQSSTAIGTLSARKIKYPSPELQKVLRAVFDSWVDISDPEKRQEYRRDFVFHMTDWLNDLDDLVALYRHPEKHSRREAWDVIYGIFIHAIHHLNAASRIFLGEELSDPFAKLYQAERRNRS